MQSKDAVTRFLNVDLDLRGNARDLDTLLKSVESFIIVLRHEGQDASIELAQQFDSLDGTVLGIIGLVSALQQDARQIWDRLESRILNVGIQCDLEPYSAFFSISAKAVELMAAHGFEIVLTVYAPRKDADR